MTPTPTDPVGGALPELVPLAGGHSGETFATSYAGERAVMRIYAGRGRARGPLAPETDAAVLRLVRGVLPVPEVLECRPPDEFSGTPGLLLTSWLPGVRADLVWSQLDAPDRAGLGGRLGELTGRMALMVTPRVGPLSGSDLEILAVPAEYADLGKLARRRSPRLGWEEAEVERLVELAEEAQVTLDRAEYSCLVHADLSLRNLLLDPDTLELTGLVDWEYAHSGTPYSDLGRLLRSMQDEAYVAAVLAGYRSMMPQAPGDLLDRARAADLFSLVELATRAAPARRAKERLLERVRAAS